MVYHCAKRTELPIPRDRHTRLQGSGGMTTAVFGLGEPREQYGNACVGGRLHDVPPMNVRAHAVCMQGE